MPNSPVEVRSEVVPFMTEERLALQEMARDFAMREVLPIANELDPACKALSPAVNDPYTAIQAIEHLGVLLAALAARPVGPQAHPGRDRRARARARSLWLAPARSVP